MADLSIENVISININESQAGIAEYKVNNIAMFTKETPLVSITGGYKSYLDASSVATDWGTTSETYLQSVAGFSQTPNPLSGGGSLIVIPMLLAQPATSGKFETSNIFANIANFVAVTDGEFKIAIDGAAAVSVTGLDFSTTTDLATIAAIIDAGLTGASAAANATNGSIVITSDATGSTTSIVLSAADAGTDITGATFLDITTGTSTSGRDLGDETVQEAIIRTKDLVYYLGILATLDIASEMPALANYMQTINKLLFFPQNLTSALNPGGNFYNIQIAKNTHTRCLLYTLGSQDARVMAAAYAFRGMGTNFNAANSTTTQNLKDLVTILPDTGIDQSIKDNAESIGVDIYPSIAGIPKVLSFGANRYFDSIFNELAYASDLEVGGFNALATVSTKVPQTEDGMTILKGAYRTVTDKYVTNQFIAPGTWNRSETFGDPQIMKDNVANFGYYIYSQPVNQQSQASREEREAPVVQIAFKEAGAIHSSIVNIYRNA